MILQAPFIERRSVWLVSAAGKTTRDRLFSSILSPQLALSPDGTIIPKQSKSDRDCHRCTQQQIQTEDPSVILPRKWIYSQKERGHFPRQAKRTMGTKNVYRECFFLLLLPIICCSLCRCCRNRPLNKGLYCLAEEKIRVCRKSVGSSESEFMFVPQDFNANIAEQYRK